MWKSGRVHTFEELIFFFQKEKHDILNKTSQKGNHDILNGTKGIHVILIIIEATGLSIIF